MLRLNTTGRAGAANLVLRRDGNVAVMFAILLPLLCLAAGAGVDFQRWSGQKDRLQSLADALALRGAREFLLANADPAKIENLLKAVAETDFPATFGVSDFDIEVLVDAKRHSVNVALVDETPSALFLKNFETFRRPQTVDATAVASGGTNVCVIALEGAASGALDASLRSTLDATKCAIMSNSTSSSGVRTTGASKILASTICSAGGYSGLESSFSTSPTTDCPATEDPLRERTAPAVGPCDYRDHMVGERNAEVFQQALVASLAELASKSSAMTRKEYALNPGVYCGGLTIGSNASVTFAPGVYIMKDGPFFVDLNAAVKGDGVAFFLDGEKSTFTFSPDTKIDLTAPNDGLLAGILFFDDPDATPGRTHSILSNDARTLLGTFYLPKSTLFVSTISPVADRSAYTAIVAQKIRMVGSPTLVLNTDYALTDVPVPDGLGPVGGEIFLRD